ncbi:MAG: hypothetical protein ACOZBL_05460 [Patescibacteria group bacterium]
MFVRSLYVLISASIFPISCIIFLRVGISFHQLSICSYNSNNLTNDI